MNVQQKASCVFLAILCVLQAVYPNSPAVSVSIVATTILFGFTLWLERRKLEAIDTIESQIKSIKDKVDSILIGKGFGR